MTRTGFAAKTFALVAKDLRIESRGRETLPPMLAFSITVALLLAFTIPAAPSILTPLRIPPGTVLAADLLAGFLWVTILFAGLVGFSRTFEFERQEGAVDTLLLAPIDRSGLFLAKGLSNLVFVLAVEAFILPVFALFFSFDLGSRWFPLVAIVVLTDIGFTSIGTLFAALAAQTRSRELILPILALPALVPIFIAAVDLTSNLLLGDPWDVLVSRGWFVILIGYDVIFSVIAALAFEYALE